MNKDRGALLLIGVAMAALGMAAVWATYGPVVIAALHVIPGS